MKKKILVVDDAQFMQKATSAMLAESYDIICASSGEEAIELYERERPDLILTDLIMPHMSGFDLQRVLQEKHQELIPIIFMSADENEENEIRGLEGGAMDYIRKPFKQDVLLRRVGNIMRHVERIQRLQLAAETDPMTGLLNKSYAQRVLGELCRRASGMLMMVDLDSFKLVNDIYGHAMGDRVLIRFSEILKSLIRTTDVAGRMGGDEFLIFCQDVREEATVAEKTRQINEMILASAKDYMGADMNIPLGASVGAVAVPDEGTDFAELYQKADKALYQAKQNGKHVYAIFHGETVPAEPETGRPAATLENLRVILEERNRQPGAYELTFDRFQTVFRYLVRAIENYHRPVELALFTLTPAGEDGQSSQPTGEMMDRFGEMLGASLRRSDVYTRSGSGQFLVILTEASDENEEAIFNRVLRNWNSGGDGQSVPLSFETLVVRT